MLGARAAMAMDSPAVPALASMVTAPAAVGDAPAGARPRPGSTAGSSRPPRGRAGRARPGADGGHRAGADHDRAEPDLEVGVVDLHDGPAGRDVVDPPAAGFVADGHQLRPGAGSHHHGGASERVPARAIDEHAIDRAGRMVGAARRRRRAGLVVAARRLEAGAVELGQHGHAGRAIDLLDAMGADHQHVRQRVPIEAERAVVALALEHQQRRLWADQAVAHRQPDQLELGGGPLRGRHRRQGTPARVELGLRRLPGHQRRRDRPHRHQHRRRATQPDLDRPRSLPARPAPPPARPGRPAGSRRARTATPPRRRPPPRSARSPPPSPVARPSAPPPRPRPARHPAPGRPRPGGAAPRRRRRGRPAARRAGRAPPPPPPGRPGRARRRWRRRRR